MAITHRGTSSVSGSASDITSTFFVSPVAGELMLLFIGGKPYDSGISSVTLESQPSEVFTRAGATRFTDGTVAAGNDSGSMFVECWYRVGTGVEGGGYTITEGSPVWNIVGVVAVVLAKGASETWQTPVVVGGGDASSGTGFSVTTGSDPGITTGDLCISFAAFNTDAATPCSSHITPTATGVTFTNTHAPSTDPETTTGGDQGLCSTRSTVSGTSSAAPVLAATLAGAGTGSALLVRTRVAASAPTGTFAMSTNPIT